MAIPKNLKSTDTGAPELQGQNGSLNAVLKWALPQLGWSIIDEDGHRTLFRQGGGPQQYLKIIDDTAIHGSTAIVCAHEFLYSAVDVDSTADLPTTGRYFIHKSVTADTTARPWRIIGNDQFFYLLIDGGSRTPTKYTPYLIGTGRSFLLADVDHFLVCRFASATSGGGDPGSISQNMNGLPAGTNMALPKGITTGTPLTAVGAGTFNGGNGNNGPSTISVNAGKVWISPLIVYETTSAASFKRVTLPGLVFADGDFRESTGTVALPTPLGNKTYEIIQMQRTLSTDPAATHIVGFFDLTSDWDGYYYD